MMDSKSFKTKVTVRFDEVDGAGILFFANIFRLAHRAFEDFVTQALSIKWNDWFENSDYVIPIKHAETNFTAPMVAGQTYMVRVSVDLLGETSFVSNTKFFSIAEEREMLHAATKMVHVFIRDLEKIKIPENIRDKLNQF